MGETERGFAEVNGTRLAYEVTGAGPVVVFVHGFTLDQRLWDDQVPALIAMHRVVRYDLRGFGRSAPPTPGESYTHADDLRALMTHLGIERATVVGLSLGGWVVLEFALSYPDSVTGLVLVDGALREYRYEPDLGEFIGTLYRIGSTDPTAAKAIWLDHPLFAASQSRPGVAARVAAMVGDYPGWHWAHHDPHLPLNPPAIQRLDEIRVPTLAVVGEHDLPDYHRIVDFLAGGIPGAQKAVIPSAGHLPNMDEPAAFNGVLLDFLDGVG